MFSKNMNVTWHNRDKKSGQMSYNDSYVSWCGGLSSIIYLAIMLAIFVYKAKKVFAGEEDSYNSFRVSNPLIDKANTITDLTKFNFMEVVNIDPDAFKNKTIKKEMQEDIDNDSIKNLNNYIEIFYVNEFID
jgi:hypothetical protein